MMTPDYTADQILEVVLEMQQGTTWVRVGGVAEPEPPGSLASEDPAGRQVYLFGWLPSGEGPGVWRSEGGLDAASPTVRAVVTLGLEQVADLTEGPYVRTIHRPAGSGRVRFRLEGSSR